MPNDNDNNQAFGWDLAQIDDVPVSGLRLLDPGEYAFTVRDMKRMHYNGSAKMSACPQAKLTLEVSDDFGSATLFHNLYLNQKCVGLIAQFFAAVGLHKHGEPLRLQWNKLVGRTGHAVIAHREYNGKTYNEVRQFLDPPADVAPADDDDGIPF